MLSQLLIPEIQQESASTKRLLERVPQEQFGWKPHEKSMSLLRLASHVAEMYSWIPVILGGPEFDFAKRTYQPLKVETTGDLVSHLERNGDAAIAALQRAGDETLAGKFTLKNGDHILFSLPRIAAVRTMSLNHLVHHRGQLSVYLRLLNVSIPGMYGPSADESR